jgi:hypothetical protein
VIGTGTFIIAITFAGAMSLTLVLLFKFLKDAEGL